MTTDLSKLTTLTLSDILSPVAQTELTWLVLRQDYPLEEIHIPLGAWLSDRIHGDFATEVLASVGISDVIHDATGSRPVPEPPPDGWDADADAERVPPVTGPAVPAQPCRSCVELQAECQRLWRQIHEHSAVATKHEQMRARAEQDAKSAQEEVAWLRRKLAEYEVGLAQKTVAPTEPPKARDLPRPEADAMAEANRRAVADAMAAHPGSEPVTTTQVARWCREAGATTTPIAAGIALRALGYRQVELAPGIKGWTRDAK